MEIIMGIDSKEAEYQKLDISVNIGNILFNIFVDSLFFTSDDDFRFTSHNHGVFEIFFIEKGQGELQIGEDKIPLTDGDCCLIAPNVFHAQKDMPRNKVYKYCMQFTYKKLKKNSSSVLIPEIQNIERLLSNKIFVHWQDKNNMLGLIRAIQNEIASKQIGYYAIVQSHFVQILINTIRAISENTHESYEMNKKSIDQNRTIIIEEFIYYNYMRPVHIGDLASQLGICVRQVDRLMRKYYNTSFKEKLLETRINIAKDMLNNTQETIGHIAEKIGYGLSGNFSSMFKMRVGITPEEFRARAILKESCP